MLSLHQQAGRLRYADNLIPTRDGGMATRPGATQALTGPVRQAQGWGDRVIAEQSGRIVVWDGEAHDIAPAGLVLQASPFQALTELAQRENRAYIADGVNPLWFIAPRAGGYEREFVTNTILDADGAPYPVPVARAIATWRNRLFTADASNRIQHCQNEKPAEWDPLWTLEFQGKRPGTVNSLCPHNETLLVGTDKAVWGVVGDSQFNFQRDELAAHGTTGPNSIDSDGRNAYWVAPQGIFDVGGEPIGEDLRELFEAGPGITQTVIDTRRRLVLCLIMNRLFVMHMDKPGLWGEIIDEGISGLVRLDSTVGWYGENGLFLLGSRDTADKMLDGSERAFTSLYDTWEDRPNLEGNGRALLNRTILHLKGSPTSELQYEAQAADGSRVKTFLTSGIKSADESIVDWSKPLEDKVPMPWPTRPVRRELVPRLAGETFRHILTATGYVEVLDFIPKYRFLQA